MLTVAILEVHNKKLRERIEELEETIRQMREVGARSGDALPDGLPHLTRREAAALKAILRRGEITREQLFFAIYGSDSDIDDKLVDVWVHKLRRKLAGTGIRIATDWGRGFRIEKLSKAA